MEPQNSPKLIVQIPCFNEENTLPETIRDIPRRIPGIGKEEILIIDDGSTDRTAEAAKASGVDHIINLKSHKGLARAFAEGIDECLRRGADIIVNTDGDNQYKGADIPKLIQPILDGRADMVIGCRDIYNQNEFSFIKKKLQKLGSWVVGKLSGAKISDAASGFRAYTRDAALRINVISDYSYTVETIIQAGKMGITIAQVPIRTNPKTRESRLYKSLWQYILYSFATILKAYAIYRPLRLFFTVGFTVFSAGFLIGLRFLYFYLSGSGAGRIQSLILAAILIILGFQISILGLIANLMSANRFLVENILSKAKHEEMKQCR